MFQLRSERTAGSSDIESERKIREVTLKVLEELKSSGGSFKQSGSTEKVRDLYSQQFGI